MNPKAVIELGGELAAEFAPGAAAEAKELGLKLLGSTGLLPEIKTVVVDGAVRAGAEDDLLLYPLAIGKGAANTAETGFLSLGESVDRPISVSRGPWVESTFDAPGYVLSWPDMSFDRAMANLGSMTENEAALARMSRSIGYVGPETVQSLSMSRAALAKALKGVTEV